MKDLTQAELDVLDLIYAGKKLKEIAAMRGAVDVTTPDHQRARAFRKLRIEDRADFFRRWPRMRQNLSQKSDSPRGTLAST